MHDTHLIHESDPGMAYRERQAWLALAALAAGYGPLFGALALGRPVFGRPIVTFLILLTVASVVRVVVLALGAWWLRRSRPGDAAQPIDERDRHIAQRAMMVGYICLMVWMILVGMVMPFHSEGLELVSAALFGLVTAEALRYTAVIAGYKRR
ncbi:MAG: hypothetical protein R3F49_23320 [Planctomycetota bacterium]